LYSACKFFCLIPSAINLFILSAAKFSAFCLAYKISASSLALAASSPAAPS